MPFKKGKVSHKIVRNAAGMDKFYELYQDFKETEVVPYAKGTPYTELCENVFPDRDGYWKNPVDVVESRHMNAIGTEELCLKTYTYMQQEKKTCDIDLISIVAGVRDDRIVLVVIYRSYGNKNPDFSGLYTYLGETTEGNNEEKEIKSRLIVPENQRARLSEEEVEEYQKERSRQEEYYRNATFERPFLNQIDQYLPENIEQNNLSSEPEYDLLTKDMQMNTKLSYPEFIQVFREVIHYIMTVEKDIYYAVISGENTPESFWQVIGSYMNRMYILPGKLPKEDLAALKEKLNNALFNLYIVGDLIADPAITDIKITSYDSIRVRVKGNAYLSNVTFIDEEDYFRFIKTLAIRNRISLNVPVQVFTDEENPDYILRFSLTAPYVTSTNVPIIHIRKVSRHKLLGEDLIAAGMMDEKIRDYLLDCAKPGHRGVVFAGPPGSGKTVALNWFLEEGYESSAEILVIQESDELFTNRKGVMFEHVVQNPSKGEQACSLEQLGQMALVAGANVFIIGEAKGAEICSAIRLANAGCRTAITIHSNSSTETIDKMADLAMLGDAPDITHAKRMLKSFETVVYLNHFKIQEISEIIGFDEEKKDMIYRSIYRRDADTKHQQ